MDRTQLELRIDDVAGKASNLLRSRFGLWVLGAISFVESALVIPLITDPFLVAYILANRSRALLGVWTTTLTSLLGGMFAYTVAFWFYEFIVTNYMQGDMGGQFLTIADAFKEGTLVITILGAVTPVPYTIVAMAAGFTKANIFIFLLGSLLGRLFRYGIVGWLTYHYGQRALEMARRKLMLATIICFILAGLYAYIRTQV